MAATVLAVVAIIEGTTMAVGFTEPYCARYAIMFTGINCRDEIFIIRKVHISFEEMCAFSLFKEWLSSERDSIALSPAGVAAHPSPKIFAIMLVVI